MYRRIMFFLWKTRNFYLSICKIPFKLKIITKNIDILNMNFSLVIFTMIKFILKRITKIK